MIDDRTVFPDMTTSGGHGIKNELCHGHLDFYKAMGRFVRHIRSDIKPSLISIGVKVIEAG